MQFYLVTSFLFPQSLRLRLFLLCLAAMHLPLAIWLGWNVATGRVSTAESLAVGSMAAAGALLALIGIGALLQPIDTLAQTLHSEAPPSAPPSLPEVGDVIRSLYAGVHRAAVATQARIADLDSAAHEDMLTGVPNRRGFLSALEALPQTARHGCLAIIDLDHFKSVNDRLGHAEGDRVLAEFGARLSAQLRRADMVARWGGEEFAIFLPDCIPDEASWSLARIAERIRRDPIALVDGRPVTFSAGIAPWHGGSLDGALRAADEALYAAKRGGRNQLRRAPRPVAERIEWDMVGT